MAEEATAKSQPDQLLSFALATFHVTSLVGVSLVFLHSSGSVGQLLAGLDTAIGLTLFLVLWALTWWTTRWVLTRAPLDPENPESGLGKALLWGYLGGAVTGISFLPVAFILVFLVSFGLDIASLIVLVVGIPVAAIVGGFVGVAFGLLDLLIYRTASAFTPSEAHGRHKNGN